MHITGINFSISAGIGFIALFGVCIQNGVILISVFRKNLDAKMHLNVAIREGVISRVRPVVMTALMAMIGLMPAALSTGVGSETQKPLAIVVIGGLVTSTILTLLILPVIYALVFKLMHRRENRMILRKMRVVSKVEKPNKYIDGEACARPSDAALAEAAQRDDEIGEVHDRAADEQEAEREENAAGE